jgi:putative flippase GtrA
MKGAEIINNIKNLFTKYNSIFRWGLVGTSTTVIDYLIFIFAYSKFTSVITANFCAGVFSISFNYFSHYLWTFKSTAIHSKSGAKFLVNLITFWSISTFLLKLLINSGIDPKIAKIIPIFAIAPLSFLSLKFIVFRKK